MVEGMPILLSPPSINMATLLASKSFLAAAMLVSLGHPVFLAQHACALCCRGCLEKWYHIPKEKILNGEEINFIINVIMAWIAKEMNNQSK